MFARFRTNIFEYGKTIANDYKTVFVDAFVEARRKPVKAMLISACLCGLGYAYKTNPSESDFLESFVERRVQLTLLPIAIHNRKTDEAMQRLTKYIQHNRLEYYNFIFFSIVLRREYGKQMGIYYSTDPNLKDWWWRRLPKNFVDFGAFGRWYNLEKYFVDYDINENEFEQNDKISSNRIN
ncbi:unnamed protein product [Dracunculus medinensis]|uniref:Uncharacterized protein n=1 Tax=Dracunculus medinensis TaxID=318479 RepID=A0A0N4UK97_DRAME|nr:unnamed protein product [Dracunculus medinensis]